MKIDLHTHILPESWPDLRERYGYGGFVQLEHHEPCRAKMLIDGKCFREIEDNCWHTPKRIFDCDTAGVDVQVISTVPVMFSYWAKPEHTLDLSKILNDHIAGVVAEHPKRFTGLGTVPMQDADLAVRELERCVKELHLPGVEVGSNVNDMNLNDPSLFPIFEAAQDLGAAIFVHPWDVIGKERMPKYWLPWLVGMPATDAEILASLACRHACHDDHGDLLFDLRRCAGAPAESSHRFRALWGIISIYHRTHRAWLPGQA